MGEHVHFNCADIICIHNALNHAYRSSHSSNLKLSKCMQVVH